MHNHLVAVTIPIYKDAINPDELMSLNQCINILKDYPIIFFAPVGLNVDAYRQVCQDKISFTIKFFEKHYFNNVAGYNQLMLSANFYKSFLRFKFILIYQLDAFVFKDDLEYWCYKNYDYIGAPFAPNQNREDGVQFLKGYSRLVTLANNIFSTNHKVSNVGNGGFSLRKTATFYRLLKLLKSKVTAWGKNNEDVFFSYWGNILFPFFKLPIDEVAQHFSIEPSTGECFKKNGNKLPFGCHAFEKFPHDVWKLYLEQSKTLENSIQKSNSIEY